MEEEDLSIPTVTVDSSGETLLHKAIKYTRPDLLQYWFTEGPKKDVNTGNNWSQTPLHYAALKRNTYVLEMLLQLPNADVTIQDMNGYNVLHSLIYNIVAIDDWERTIQTIVSLGIDINQTTKHGYSVLHLASRHSNPSCVLRYLLESFQDLKVTIVNNDGENFLHSFIHSINHISPASAEFKERFALLDEIVNGKLNTCREEHVLDLMKQQDVNGVTPFLLILSQFDKYRNVNVIKLLKKMAGFGGCASIPDNLGNCPIHYAVTCLRKSPAKLLKMLTDIGIDVNAKNIFDQSTAHLVRVNKTDISFERIKSIRNILNTTSLDFNRQDKWLCTPWMYVSTFYDSDCLPFLQDIKSSSSNIDAVDINGSTVLHHAAYHDSTEFIKVLLENGAKTDIEDKLGETPLDTARRHLNASSEAALLKYTNSEKIYDKNHQLMDNLLKLHKSLKVDMDMDEFVEQMLDHAYRKRSEEEDFINSTILYFVEQLCKQVETYDSRFAMSAFQSGSSAEKTKVNKPDEYDFVLCLDRIAEFCSIVQKRDGKSTLTSNKLKLQKADGYEEFMEFFDEDETFITPTVFMYFHKYLKRALHESSMWSDKNLQNLCYIFETPFLEKHMKTTVFMTRLLWIGSVHKQLCIKIDMVPAIRKAAWWPIDPYSIPLMTTNIQDAGCLLMLDTKGDDDTFTSEYLKEFIVDCIERITPKPTDLRISTAPAEICLMKSSPQKIRDSYALAKLFVELSSKHDITSYMLKNCLFYVLQDLDWNPNKPDNFETTLSIRELTVMIFQKLLKFNKEWCLRRFFLPEVNIFLPDEDIQDKNSQKWDIKFVLRILGEAESLESDDGDDDIYCDDENGSSEELDSSD